MSKRVFSGIQPSGEIHIGNYLGAIKNWIELINEFDCIFCIVDYHALTIKYDPEDLKKRIWNAVTDNIACGIDPEKSHLFIQSHVPEHTELAWILNTVTSMGDLERMTQFKDKAKQHRTNINAGLFTYPVLQTADIALYKANLVPVGEDQVQHIELAREIVRSFNNRFGEVLVEPQEKLSKASRIMGLDGKSKMSKSMNNYIALSEDQESLKKKVMSAVTDENRVRKSDPGNPEICNVFSLHAFFTDQSEIDNINEQCRVAGIGCVDCKKTLMKGIWNVLEPIQAKKQDILNHFDKYKEIIVENGKSCRKIAQETISEVRDTMGLNS